MSSVQSLLSAYIIALILLPRPLDAKICLTEVCEYDLTIRHDRTMVYRHETGRAYDVGLNGTKLQLVATTERQPPDDLLGTFVDEADVFTVDGFKRNIVLINDQFRGPAIEVREGAQVAVKVTNKLHSQGLTIHWHGLKQHGSPWMDGVPHVTQCEVMPGQTFTYRFIASPVGTHWYHSHVTGQLTDGMYGIFIIHKVVPTLTEFPLLVGDWYHEEGHTIEVVNPSSIESEDKGHGQKIFAARYKRDYVVDNTAITATVWTSALINGRGRYGNGSYPLTKFHVERGKSYKFRMVNVGAEFALQISIDSHSLRVVSLDGNDIVPIETDYIMISPGERVDFEVVANQIEGRYWLRAQSPQDVKRYKNIHEVKAVVVYEHITDDIDPTSNPAPCTSTLKCRVFNCPFKAYPASYNTECIHLTDAKSAEEATVTAAQHGLNDDDIQEVFLNIGYHSVGTSINAKKFSLPSAPLYQKDSKTVSCSKACADKTKGCICTNIVTLDFNKTIQVVISNFQPTWFAGHHPMHLHGHNFAVVKMGFALQNATSGHYVGFNPDVTCDDDGTLCRSTRWNGTMPSLMTVSPVVKDTVWVPARGYVVLRFRTLNPGYWLIHCHMNHHADNGMMAVFHSGPGYYPPPPDNFPSCHSFDMTKEEFRDYKITYDKYFNGPGNLDPRIGVITTTRSTTNDPVATTVRVSPTKSPDLKCRPTPSDGYITLRTSEIIGGAVGFVFVGLVVAVIPLLTYICLCRSHGSPNAGQRTKM